MVPSLDNTPWQCFWTGRDAPKKLKLATAALLPNPRFYSLPVSSFNKFCWGLSWVLVPVFPFCWARHRFRNVCCLRKHLTKVVLRFFRLLCFIPILHSKTWVVHMAANIEVTSETKKSSVLRFKVIPNKRETYVARNSPKSPCLSEIFFRIFWQSDFIGFQMPSCKGSRHQKWAWQAMLGCATMGCGPWSCIWKHRLSYLV